MLQPLQLQEVGARYAKEITEVREFLVKAGFTPGKASSLGTVTDRLRQDRTMRRDLTSHVWVVLHTSKASYAELLALVTLAAAGPQFAADADEDEAHDLLRFLMGARGEFEGAPARPVTAVVAEPTPVAPVPVVAAPVVPAVAATPVAVPVAAPIAPTVIAPLVEAPAAAAPVVAAAQVPVAPTPVAIAQPVVGSRARITDTTIPGNLPPLRKGGDLPPLRFGGSSDDSFYDKEPEGEGRMAIVAAVVCLLAILLFGGAIWRYQWVQKRQVEVRQQEEQQLKLQQQSDPSAAMNAGGPGAKK